MPSDLFLGNPRLLLTNAGMHWNTHHVVHYGKLRVEYTDRASSEL